METEPDIRLTKWQKHKRHAIAFAVCLVLASVLTAGITGILSLFNNVIRELRDAKTDVYRICNSKHTCVEAKIVSWSGVSATVKLFPSNQLCDIDSVLVTQALWVESR